jgi:hypothetical protein
MIMERERVHARIWRGRVWADVSRDYRSKIRKKKRLPIKAVQKNSTGTQAKRKPTTEKNHTNLYIPPSVYTEKEPQDSKLCEK